MSDARTDERVEIAAEGIHARAYGDNGTSHTRSESESDAAAGIAALEAEGYTVARLAQVGWVSTGGYLSTDPIRADNPAWSPVYRIIDAPAVEEPGAGFACRLCGCSFTTEALRSMHEVNTCVHDRPAPAGTECPTCEGTGYDISIIYHGEEPRLPCPTCSPNETSEQ